MSNPVELEPWSHSLRADELHRSTLRVVEDLARQTVYQAQRAADAADQAQHYAAIAKQKAALRAEPWHRKLRRRIRTALSR